MKTNCDDLGKLVLRLTLAALLLLHGISKARNGVGWMDPMLAAHGLPSFIAYGVFLGELVAPVLLILGVYTRVAGLLVAGVVMVAVWLVHVAQLFSLNPETGGYALELQALYLLGGVLEMLLGAGRYSLGGTGGKWN